MTVQYRITHDRADLTRAEEGARPAAARFGTFFARRFRARGGRRVPANAIRFAQ